MTEKLTPVTEQLKVHRWLTKNVTLQDAVVILRDPATGSLNLVATAKLNTADVTLILARVEHHLIGVLNNETGKEITQ